MEKFQMASLSGEPVEGDIPDNIDHLFRMINSSTSILHGQNILHNA